MGMDYTVVVRVRHQMGDKAQDYEELLLDIEAPFAGVEEDFRFSCPNVDSSQEAILQFEHRGATELADHPVYINSQALMGGVPAGPRFKKGFKWPADDPDYPMWSTRSLLIQPGLLKEDNVLTFQSRRHPLFNIYDNFTIDNVVVFFKTRSGPLGGQPEVTDVKG